ncbi:uncharacterized protein [Argopecten irradians]|uniref:uncharacterized protein n=1 Tax=Argopecten irradians TaxID=31199 RepID=UPI0037245286
MGKVMSKISGSKSKKKGLLIKAITQHNGSINCMATCKISADILYPNGKFRPRPLSEEPVAGGSRSPEQEKAFSENDDFDAEDETKLPSKAQERLFEDSDDSDIENYKQPFSDSSGSRYAEGQIQDTSEKDPFPDSSQSRSEKQPFPDRGQSTIEKESFFDRSLSKNEKNPFSSQGDFSPRADKELHDMDLPGGSGINSGYDGDTDQIYDGMDQTITLLATGSDDCTIRLYGPDPDKNDLNDYTCLYVYKGHEKYITCIVFWDEYMISGSADSTIRKWDMTKQGDDCCVYTINGHEAHVERVLCTGSLLFSTSYDRTARCWDFATGDPLRVFHGHRMAVVCVIFIPADSEYIDDEDPDSDKDILITGSLDGTARSWDIHTTFVLNIFLGHAGPITCMATDSEAKYLFTGSTDHTVRMWQLSSASLVRIFEGHKRSIVCMQTGSFKDMPGLMVEENSGEKPPTSG